jgi:cytochrome c peroxidase
MNTKFYLPLLLLAAASCTETEKKKVAQKEEPISVEDQQLWAQAQNYFEPVEGYAENPDNPITEEKIALGKKLYYDTRLSLNGNNSCNSCHNLASYGVDNETFSTGDAGKKGGRNSPTVLNAALAAVQFWDGRARDVEEQSGMPILNPVEMAIPSKDFLEKRLSETKEYPALFAAAFPKENNPLRYENLQKAIGAFERTLITPSRFDDFIGKHPGYLNKDEKEGLRLFIETGCTNCHSGKGIGGRQMQKFGVHGNYMMATKSLKHDAGRQDITKNSTDADVFRVPGLRNVAMTAPYFHDGSVSDLNEAVKIMARIQLNKVLTDEKAAKITAFLKACTGEVPAIALNN